ncbi:MAG: hypothetical protein AAFQ94_30330 [Bacteroidota bacterium]
MKTILFQALLLLVLLQTAIAQTNEQVYSQIVRVAFGSGHISLKDPVFSPLVYRGSGSIVELGYQNYRAHRKHELMFNFSSSELTPTLNGFSQSRNENTNLVLNYQFQKPLKNIDESWFVGVGFNNFISVRELIISGNSEIGWDIFSSLNLVSSYDLIFNTKHSIQFTIGIPIISYVVGRMRIPKDFPERALQQFLEDDDASPVGAILTSGDFLPLGEFFDLTSEINYRLRMSQRLGFAATYRFRYYSYRKFRQVQYGTSQYIFGFTYQFGK